MDCHALTHLRGSVVVAITNPGSVMAALNDPLGTVVADTNDPILPLFILLGDYIVMAAIIYPLQFTVFIFTFLFDCFINHTQLYSIYK